MFTINVPRGRKLSRCLKQPLHVMDGGKMKHIKSAFERPFVVTGAGGKAVVGASNGVVLALVPIQNYEGAPREPVLLPEKAADTTAARCRSLKVDGGRVTATDLGEGARLSSGKPLTSKLPPQEGLLPPLGRSFPDLKKCTAVVIDADELARLAGAISATGVVTLLVPPRGRGDRPDAKPVAVVGQSFNHCMGNDPLGEGGGFGVIMQLGMASYEVERVRQWLTEQVRGLPSQEYRFPAAAAGAKKGKTKKGR